MVDLETLFLLRDNSLFLKGLVFKNFAVKVLLYLFKTWKKISTSHLYRSRNKKVLPRNFTQTKNYYYSLPCEVIPFDFFLVLLFCNLTKFTSKQNLLQQSQLKFSSYFSCCRQVYHYQFLPLRNKIYEFVVILYFSFSDSWPFCRRAFQGNYLKNQ